jgi:uncharacterized protein involved in exopolysaccharide biosynthesis
MRFLRTLLQHWYLYLVPIILIPILVTVYGFDKLTLYNSTATLYVDKSVLLSSDQNPYLTPAQNEATEMQQLLSSESFVVTVAAKTDLAQRYNLNTETGKAQANTRIVTEVAIAASGVGPNILAITVSDKEPHLAQQIVTALLAYYQSYYMTHRLDRLLQLQTYYKGQWQTAFSALAQDNAHLQDYCRQHLDACVPTAPIDTALAQLQSQQAQDQKRVTDFQAQLDEIASEMAATSTVASGLFTVTDPPTVPLRPSLEKKKLLETYTGGGLAAALALVALIVFIRTQLDRKVYAEDDLQIIQEDLGLMLGGGIVTLPIIAGMDAPTHAHSDPDDALEGILVPVLTALPRLRAQDVRRELRKAAGAPPAALASATAEDSES